MYCATHDYLKMMKDKSTNSGGNNIVLALKWVSLNIQLKDLEILRDLNLRPTLTYPVHLVPSHQYRFIYLESKELLDKVLTN